MEMGRSVESINGSLKLPIGFRFQPSDEELLIHYLKRKILCLPLPATVIPEFEAALHEFNPWDLPGELNEKRYFFSKRKRNSMNKYWCSTDCGYWKKSSGKDKQIMSAAGNTSFMIGIKKSYVFYHNLNLQGRNLKTQWVMQELCLNTPIFLPHHQRVVMQVGDWVVCRLYQRKRTTTNYKYLKNELPETTPSSSSSCASGITEEISSATALEDDQEASSQSAVLIS